MMKSYFLVTSRGHCATQWLARAFNICPSVTCSHGSFELGVALRDNPTPTPEERKHTIEVVKARRASQTVDDIFDELEEGQSSLVYGNVHHFTIRALLSRLRVERSRREIRFVNLVRNPICWVDSAARNHENAAYASPVIFKSKQEYFLREKRFFESILGKYAVDFSDIGNLSFLMAAFSGVSGLASEVGLPGVPQVTMEKLTGDKVFFSELSQSLFKRDGLVTDGWVEEVFSWGPLNAHSAVRGMAAEEKFDQWPEWKRACMYWVAKNVREFANFEKVGYDLGFLYRR